MSMRVVGLQSLLAVAWVSLFSALPVAADSGSPHEHAPSHHHAPAAAGHEAMPDKLPPSGMEPEEDLEYSRFMHHSAGLGMLLIGALLLADRLTTHRYRFLRTGVGLTWVVLGLFLFIFSDLEAWPIGPAGFMESFDLPTAHEWIQHHLLAMIPMGLGIYTMASRWKEPAPVWRYLASAVAVAGGVGLLIHQHLDHPGFDFVNFQHRLFALTSFFIAAGLAVEGSARITWKAKPYLLPAGLLLMGIQLALYVE